MEGEGDSSSAAMARRARLEAIRAHPSYARKHQLGELLQEAHFDPRIAGDPLRGLFGNQRWSVVVGHWRNQLLDFIPGESDPAALMAIEEVLASARKAGLPFDWIAGLCKVAETQWVHVPDHESSAGIDAALLGEHTNADGGFWVNLAIPDLTGILPSEMDAVTFHAWFRPCLLRYRSQMLERESLPTDELARMALHGQTLKRMEQMLAPGGIPPRARAALAAWARKNDVDWNSLMDRLERDVAMLAVLAGELTRKGTKERVKRGAKNKAPRDELLATLVERLRDTPLKADVARYLATQILQRCGIQLPAMKGATDSREVRRVEMRGQK